MLTVVRRARCSVAQPPAFAQDTTGTIEGAVTDTTRRVVAGARSSARNLDTGFTQETTSAADGFYRLLLLPVGRYSADRRSAAVRARWCRSRFRSTSARPCASTLQLDAAARHRDGHRRRRQRSWSTRPPTRSARVVTGRELVDLPLNGRNFTQLGLLQTGVAPLTAGVATAGGSLRQGQAYAVNGMRPEQNVYLVDGAQNMNRMDGGYALRLPVDAIAEFRILTQSAPPEFGGTGGATTSVVTRSGGNQLHGSLYEFLRNDAFDARQLLLGEGRAARSRTSSAARSAARSKQDRALFFGYYEGLRNRQGITTTATVPTAAERRGDFSGLGTPLLNLAAGGMPFPGNQIPDGGHQPGRAERAGPVSARQRLAVDLPRDAGRHQRLRPGRRPRRLQRVAERSVLRPLLVLGRPQPQPDLGPRHRRARLPDARRPSTHAATVSQQRTSSRRR